MTVAAVLLAIAALGGVVMAAMRFGGRELPPMALALIHGLFAASGLVALIEGSGLLLLSVGGWYGGHLVFHHGVGRERRSEG